MRWRRTLSFAPAARICVLRDQITASRVAATPSPVLCLQLILAEVGIIQKALQQGDLLIVGTLLVDFQHLILMLKTNELLPESERKTD